MPLRLDCSSAAASVAASACSASRSTRSSNSGPATAASSSTSRVGASSRASRWLTTSRTVSGVPSSASGRVRRAMPPPISMVPVSIIARQSSVIRKALPCGQVADRLGQLGQVGDGGGARGAQHELGHLLGRQPAQPQPHHALRAPQLHQRLGQLGGDVGLGVAERGQQQHARVRGGPGQVPQQEQRRRVGPVAVLQHQQQRPAAAGCDQQVGHLAVEPVALGVLVGHHRLRQPPDHGRQVGQEPRQLAAASAEVVAQAAGIGRPHQLVERLHHRPVGRAHVGVAGAVEHDRARCRGLGRELAHQPALARAWLAADQRDPAALVVGARHQRAQRRQLAWAAHERERGPQPQRSGSGCVWSGDVSCH